MLTKASSDNADLVIYNFINFIFLGKIVGIRTAESLPAGQVQIDP